MVGTPHGGPLSGPHGLETTLALLRTSFIIEQRKSRVGRFDAILRRPGLVVYFAYFKKVPADALKIMRQRYIRDHADGYGKDFEEEKIECWAVGEEVSEETLAAIRMPKTGSPSVRVMDEHLCVIHAGRYGVLRTPPGTHEVANEEGLAVACGTLEHLLDARLVKLRDFRPNSKQEVTKRDKEIKELEALKKSVVVLAQMVGDGTIKQEAVVGFTEALKRWWSSNYEGVCSDTYGVILAMTALTVGSYLQVYSSGLAIVVSAIVGRTSVGKALKKVGKKLFD